MKSTFLNFLRKYWLCMLLSVLMVVGTSLATRYGNLYESSDPYRLDLGEVYLVFVIPLISLIYGCLSYFILKRIWVPLLILGVINFLYWFRFGMDALTWEGTYIWTLYPVIFSLLGALASAFIKAIVKEIKASYDKNSKTEEQNIETE